MIFLALAALPAAADMDMTMGMHMDSHAQSHAQAHEGKGKINSVDAQAGKINLTHEPIASLDWPEMTMDFTVQDKASLSSLKTGQKVVFKLIETRPGKYVISEIKAIGK
jgi:Cu(I)/Ag(I) efflux system protein CusF